jgi:hypothetical protein
MLEALVETTKDVDDEDPVIDGWPQIDQCVDHALEFVTLLAH